MSLELTRALEKLSWQVRACLARQSLPGTVSFPAGEGGRAFPGGLQRSSATSGRAVRTLFTRWREVMPVLVHPTARQ